MASQDETLFSYEPENTKHIYGKSDRWPAEKIIVRHINEIHATRPDLEMVLIGTSGVFGEKFPLYITQCEFSLPDRQSIDRCVVALKTSDELIRRRVDALWSWEFAWGDDDGQVLFCVNWYDFAYFMQNKEIFLGKDHGRFALDFGLDVRQMRFVHWRVLRDGSFVVFDIDKISARKKDVVANLDKIRFGREFREPRF